MATSRRRICSGTAAGLLIDLDGVVQHRSAVAHARAWRRDRARLLRNWPSGCALQRWLDEQLAGGLKPRVRQRSAGRSLAAADQPAVLSAFGGLAELHRVQARVVAVGGQQLGVRAALDDASLVHDQDQVGLLDGRQPVRDDQRRAPRPSGGRAAFWI
jgi:hypothetical protein